MVSNEEKSLVPSLWTAARLFACCSLSTTMLNLKPLLKLYENDFLHDEVKPVHRSILPD